MRTALVIARKDLKLRLRDRSAIGFAFVAPLLLAAIISLAFRGAEEGFHMNLAIADLDRGEITSSFVEGIETALGEAVTVKRFDSSSEAEAEVAEDRASAAFLIPAGFTEAVQTGRPADIRVVRNAGSPLGGEIAEAIARGFVTEVNAGRLAVGTAVAAGALARPDAVGIDELVRRAAAGRIPIGLSEARIGGRQVSSASYYGPAMAIFFLSFTVNFGLVGILAERRQGTLSRILASPTRPAAAIFGKTLGAFLLGLISFGLMAVATTYLLGADWGPPLGVALLGAATIFAFIGVAAIGITLARTEEGAAGFVGIVMTLFALLGGNFIRLTDAPPLIKTLSLGTPNGWAIRGFVDLSTGAGLASIAPSLAALVAIGILTSLIGVVRGRKLVTG